MKTLNQYSLYLLTLYAAACGIWAFALGENVLLIQKCVAAMLIIVTLHEWEEQRFPGGFFDVMGGIMDIDLTNADRHAMCAKPDTFILVLTGLALLLPQYPLFTCAVLILGIFEGFIHVAGIKIGHLGKPYSPGMITAEVYAVAAIISIVLLNRENVLTGTDWLLSIPWYIACFIVLEFSVWGAAGLTPKELAAKMKANMKRFRGQM